MPQIKKWAEYLEEKGMDPENQLSTDDFAGHLAHNTNLSIKAIEALGAFVQIARGVGDQALANKYDTVVRKLPARWQQMATEGDHYKLAFDQSGTWSQKYNLVWDNLLDLHLFPKEVAQEEWGFYVRKMQPYGLSLDNARQSVSSTESAGRRHWPPMVGGIFIKALADPVTVKALANGTALKLRASG
jgi:hypothetical protein